MKVRLLALGLAWAGARAPPFRPAGRTDRRPAQITSGSRGGRQADRVQGPAGKRVRRRECQRESERERERAKANETTMEPGISRGIICLLLVIQVCTAAISSRQLDNNDDGHMPAARSTTIGNGRAADRAPRDPPDGRPTISEAHQLYCAECLASCGAGPSLAGSRGASGATPKGTQLALECRCRAVYDSRHRSLRCQNMSTAQAGATNAAGRPQLAARAGAASRAHQNA